MSSIQDNLRRHLFSRDAENLLQTYPQPSSLFNGVNYFYKEKVWNIRLSWDKDVCDDIQGVFIRVHSKDSFYGYHFACDKNASDVINYDVISLKNPDKESRSKQKEEFVPFKFIKHLSSSTPAQDEVVPKLTGNLAQVVTFININIFFQKAHHLLPELHNALEDIDLQVPHFDDIFRQNDDGINPLWGIIPLLILFGGGIYVMVKIAHYVRNQGQRVLNN